VEVTHTASYRRMDFGNHCVTAAERQGQNRATRISRITAALKVSKSDFCKTARLTRNLPVHQPSKFPLRGAPTYPHGRTTAAIIADAGMCGQFPGARRFNSRPNPAYLARAQLASRTPPQGSLSSNETAGEKVSGDF